MLRQSLLIGAALLTMALALPGSSSPAAAFPVARTPAVETGVVLVNHRRSHDRYRRYHRRSWNDRGYHRGSGIYLNFGVPYGYYGSGYGYDDGYDDGGYGYYDDAPVYQRYYSNRGGSHERWCLNRYRTYNPRTDTFIGYDGRRHTCRGPY